MIEGLRPYPAYRDSDVSWLGSRPQHWDAVRCRFLFREVDERSVAGEETHLSMSQKLGLVPASQVTRTLVSESYAGGKLCETNDLVLNRLKAHLGVFSTAKQSGVISPDYTVLRPRRVLQVRYFEEVLRSPACRWELRTRTKGIVEGFWRLYTDDFYNIRVPVPPPDEQAGIVKFLDHADRRIRRYVRTKRKLINLLEEQKHAKVDHAVLQGLHAARTLRAVPHRSDARIPWLASLPQGWRLVPSKAMFEPRLELARTEDEQLSATQAYGVIEQARYEALIGRRIVKINLHLEKRRHVEEGDFIISMRSFQGGLERAWVSGCIRSSYVVLKPREEIHVPYFAYLLKTRSYIRALQATANFIRDGQDLNLHNFAQVELPVPPLGEQRQIAAHLDQFRGQIEATQARAEEEIALLEECRTRLIADVVTGKLDVREAAANLPDELDTDGPELDETDGEGDESDLSDEQTDE